VRLFHVLGLLGTAVGLTAGCASGGQGSVTASSASAPASVSATSDAVAAPPQLDFVAKTVGGQEFSGATLVGKPAVFWFWTPWCPTCQGEAPEVAKLAKANPDITFVGVSAVPVRGASVSPEP
jgi:thiol-disulfide isomerase/thioredoxin